MNNFPQQPTPPQASGIKRQWIILGSVIGVLVLVLGGCVACGALIGLSSLTNSNLANTDADDPDQSAQVRSKRGEFRSTSRHYLDWNFKL
ncbi:MAG TPA: hypothetical protein VE056_02930 [Pyrinomonadaceae bacterium]|nr:hypothetical protein [Pyrinomonadaceae bacterium]